jgi:hypothetical protein
MKALEQEPGIRWWLNTEQVQGYVHAVFEGGGAKGVLYAGALEAVLKGACGSLLLQVLRQGLLRPQ